MSKEQPIEVFMPPNMLKAKIGGRAGGIDMAAVKRAEQALDGLKSEFSGWVNKDVAALGETYQAFKASGTKDARDALYRASHDLRGQALTFEYPLVARVASSLCKLLDAERVKVPMALIDAHVNAIRVIVRQNVQDTDDKVANTLASELDAHVAEFLGDSGEG